MRTLRPSGLRLTNSFSARSCPSTTTVAPAFASWEVNGRPCSILRVMMSKYRSVVPSSVIPWARFPLYSTAPRSSEYHAVIAGTVRPRVTASASSSLMRGRRRHERHVESSTLKLTFGRCRRWKVFTPTNVPANLSVMYTFMPFTIDQAPIRNVTPMKTPMRENPLFSFWARICCSASRSASNNGTSGGPLLVGGDQPHHRHVFVAPDLQAHAAQRAHDLRPHVVLARELVREDDDVGQGGVARVKFLDDHAGFLPRLVSAARREAFTAAPSCRSRIA